MPKDYREFAESKRFSEPSVPKQRRSGGQAKKSSARFHLNNRPGSILCSLSRFEQRGNPGLFRVLQMQRCVRAEMEKGKLRLHGSHASSPENLAQIVEIFEREGGRRPVEKARAARAAAKAKRAKK